MKTTLQNILPSALIALGIVILGLCVKSGIDRFTYPFSRSYTVGAQVSF